MKEFVIFSLGGQRYGVPLSQVDRIVRIVEITPLPKAPEIVRGIINVQGQLIPVINVRRRFRLAERKDSLTDQLIIMRTVRRTVAMAVDAVTGILDFAENETVSVGEILPNLEYIDGVAKHDNGLVLIHDVNKFLSLEEDNELEQAMKG
jgi:purine-binding chemotaxis protein CheW